MNKGDQSEDMFVFLIGEAGVYDNDDDQPVHLLTENMSFGERSLRVDEKIKQTVVAHKVCVCLSLNRHDF